MNLRVCKQQSAVWMFQDGPNPTNVACARSTSKQMIACFFGKTGHVAIVPLNNAEQSILSGTEPFVCQLSSKKSGKSTAEDGALEFRKSRTNLVVVPETIEAPTDIARSSCDLL